ncbi:uncharacterized protein EMH_0043820 [Eimeria mitis]|uniref:Uncharacterized protein n=1 Tax=Eimeria mitis TaxID=44415 RepID=U6JZ29_9EIME|nr:uncharacterized protein EMH_0043820 [Eimeria mitis]CDJ28773.1 hypothetical protein EMH_0043820 [Eimeria mitis]
MEREGLCFVEDPKPVLQYGVENREWQAEVCSWEARLGEIEWGGSVAGIGICLLVWSIWMAMFRRVEDLIVAFRLGLENREWQARVCSLAGWLGDVEASWSVGGGAVSFMGRWG